MSETVIIALITNGTVLAVAAIQGWLHRKHERVSKDTNATVRKLGNGKA